MSCSRVILFDGPAQAGSSARCCDYRCAPRHIVRAKKNPVISTGFKKFGRGCLKGPFLLCVAALLCKCEKHHSGCISCNCSRFLSQRLPQKTREGGSSQARRCQALRVDWQSPTRNSCQKSAIARRFCGNLGRTDALARSRHRGFFACNRQVPAACASRAQQSEVLLTR